MHQPIAGRMQRVTMEGPNRVVETPGRRCPRLRIPFELIYTRLTDCTSRPNRKSTRFYSIETLMLRVCSVLVIPLKAKPPSFTSQSAPHWTIAFHNLVPHTVYWSPKTSSMKVQGTEPHESLFQFMVCSASPWFYLDIFRHHREVFPITAKVLPGLNHREHGLLHGLRADSHHCDRHLLADPGS